MIQKFKIQQEALDILNDIEDNLPRNIFSQFWKANVINKIEDLIEKLWLKVLDVVNAAEITRIDAKITEHDAEL